jgi:hypothetical protein
MGILADFFEARDTTASDYTEDPDRFPCRVQSSGVTPLEVSILWAILEEQEWSVELMDRFEMVASLEEGSIVTHRLPAPLVETLVGANESMIARAARAWASTEELQLWSESDARQFLVELTNLCRQPRDPSRSIYLWNCA